MKVKLRFKLLRRIARWKIFAPIRLSLRFAQDVYEYASNQIKKSIRLELMLTFGICFLTAMLIYGVSGSIYSSFNRTAVIDYSNEIDRIEQDARNIANEINAHNTINGENNFPSSQSSNDDTLLQSYIDNHASIYRLKILIVNLDGKVIMKSNNATENEVDVYSAINNAMSSRTMIDREYMQNNSHISTSPQEVVSFFPVTYNNTKGYVIVSGFPTGEIQYVYHKDSLLALINGFLAFFILFYIITHGRMRYIEELANGLLEISKGNFSYRVKRKGEDELGSLADNINAMIAELERTIEEERMAERTKTELITNVSHDLRTPLTSIMGYLRLLKDKRFETEEQLQNYIDIAYGKSEKLKTLIEDLFEYTKLGSNSTKLNYEIISLNDLLQQLMDELVPVSEDNGLTFKQDFPAEKVYVNIDVDKMVRVFDNLLMNAIKYSNQPGEILVKIVTEDDQVTIAIRNHGEPISQEHLIYLFERFYRVEKSRSSETGGSGLGLAIAKSIVAMHQGEIWAECKNELITFCIQLKII